MSPSSCLLAPASARSSVRARAANLLPCSRRLAPLHRFALVIGSNDGGGARDRLRYAAHDAMTIADVLKQLGGVNPISISRCSASRTRTRSTARSTA